MSALKLSNKFERNMYALQSFTSPLDCWSRGLHGKTADQTVPTYHLLEPSSWPGNPQPGDLAWQLVAGRLVP